MEQTGEAYAALEEYPVQALAVYAAERDPVAGGAVWRVDTDRGPKCLRRLRPPAIVAKLAVAVHRHLEGKGARVPQLALTGTGDPYATSGGGTYVLMEWLAGSEPGLFRPAELAVLARVLASFHRAGEGFPWPGGELGGPEWPQAYARIARECDEAAWFAGARSDAASRLVAASAPAQAGRAREALRRLLASPYPLLAAGAPARGYLCRDGFSEHDIRLCASGPFLVRFTKSSCDLPVRDLRRLVNRVMKAHGRWDAGLLSTIVAAYGEERPLSPAELEVLAIDLACPHLYHSCIRKAFRGLRPVERVPADEVRRRVALEASKDAALAALGWA
ncbi:MAG: hypothetical protein AB1492_05840 [Bacillota bacterium]